MHTAEMASAISRLACILHCFARWAASCRTIVISCCADILLGYLGWVVANKILWHAATEIAFDRVPVDAFLDCYVRGWLSCVLVAAMISAQVQRIFLRKVSVVRTCKHADWAGLGVWLFIKAGIPIINFLTEEPVANTTATAAAILAPLSPYLNAISPIWSPFVSLIEPISSLRSYTFGIATVSISQRDSQIIRITVGVVLVIQWIAYLLWPYTKSAFSAVKDRTLAWIDEHAQLHVEIQWVREEEANLTTSLEKPNLKTYLDQGDMNHWEEEADRILCRVEAKMATWKEEDDVTATNEEMAVATTNGESDVTTTNDEDDLATPERRAEQEVLHLSNIWEMGHGLGLMKDHDNDGKQGVSSAVGNLEHIMDLYDAERKLHVLDTQSLEKHDGNADERIAKGDNTINVGGDDYDAISARIPDMALVTREGFDFDAESVPETPCPDTRQLTTSSEGKSYSPYDKSYSSAATSYSSDFQHRTSPDAWNLFPTPGQVDHRHLRKMNMVSHHLRTPDNRKSYSPLDTSYLSVDSSYSSINSSYSFDFQRRTNPGARDSLWTHGWDKPRRHNGVDWVAAPGKTWKDLKPPGWDGWDLCDQPL